MTVFVPFAAIDDPLFTRRLSYVTGVRVADDGTEQRDQPRAIPREEWTFLARTLRADTTGWLDALLYGGTTTLYTIPYWPHGALLTAAATAGSAVVLSVDPTNRDFTVGGRAVLWRGEGTTEEVTVSAVGASSITAGTLANNWPAGTYVFPAKRGRFTGNIESRRLAAAIADAPLTFAIEHGSDPGVSTPASPEVFDVVPYIRRDVTHQLDRLVDRVENPTYTWQDIARRPTPIGARPFRVWLATRQAVSDLIAWFHGLKGACTPFWLPTYQQDFHVTAGLGTDTLTITRCGFTANRPADGSRDHLAFVEVDGTVTHRTITNAVDNGMAANTETLTLDDVSPAAATLTSYLLLGRLSSDTLEIRWRTNRFAECEMGFVELPAEIAEVVA